MVLLGQVRTQQQERRQVDFARGEVLEHDRKLSGDAGRAGAPKGGVFREAQFVHAVRGDARTAAFAVNPARLDLGKVGHERRQELIGAPHQTAGAGVKFVIRDVGKTVDGSRSLERPVDGTLVVVMGVDARTHARCALHERSLHPEISSPRLAR